MPDECPTNEAVRLHRAITEALWHFRSYPTTAHTILEDAVRDKLSSGDSQPPPGTVVRDIHGRQWERQPEGYWLTEGDTDPESWVYVAGNHGPVTVIRMPNSADADEPADYR